MKNRTDIFESLPGHLIYGKVFKRLTQSDLAFCRAFLKKHEFSDTTDFAVAVRNLLFAPGKPTNVLLMDELLMATNIRSVA